MIAVLPTFVLWLSSVGAACTIDSLVLSRDTVRSYVLARATNDTVLVPTTPQSFRERFLPLPSPGAFEQGIPVGQRFQIIDAASQILELHPGDMFLAVPWEYLADCSLARWSKSGRWVEPGTEVLFFLSPTRYGRGPEIVVDVMGWHQPYPVGEFWRYETRSTDSPDREEWLTAREYYRLLGRLPSMLEWRASWSAALSDSVTAVFAESERWRSRFPATAIIARLGR